MEVTQKLPDTYKLNLNIFKRNAAFEDWRRKLRKGEQLPRGKFFKGQKPGSGLIIIDECWSAVRK